MLAVSLAYPVNPVLGLGLRYGVGCMIGIPVHPLSPFQGQQTHDFQSPETGLQEEGENLKRGVERFAAIGYTIPTV